MGWDKFEFVGSIGLSLGEGETIEAEQAAVGLYSG